MSNIENKREFKGNLILILGSSGSGKGTVLEYLRQRHQEFVFPVSCTTRKRRFHEKDGDVYNFISLDEFKGKINSGDFLEWAFVHKQNYYGTLKQPIFKSLRQGKTVIREVDVHGLKSIRGIISSKNLFSIFITVKDWDTLKNRILTRSPMSEAELAQRKESFDLEMEWVKECDYVVESVEGDIQGECEEIEKIILEKILNHD